MGRLNPESPVSDTERFAQQPQAPRESRHTGPATVADCQAEYSAGGTVRDTAGKKWKRQARKRGRT